jgi:hypothetical protein
MKKIFFSLLLVAGSTMIFAQNGQPDRSRRDQQMPSTVQKSFERDNPGVTNANWDRRNNNQWHGTYRDKNNRDVEVFYDRSGHRMSTHKQWDRNDFPKDLDHRFNTRYHTSDYQVYRIERPKAKPLFQIRFQLGGKDKTVYMDERGRETRYTGY